MVQDGGKSGFSRGYREDEGDHREDEGDTQDEENDVMEAHAETSEAPAGEPSLTDSISLA